MKISVDLSDSEVKEICSITGEKKKGPAIRKMVVDALMLRRRADIAQKFISGEWSAELKGFEEARELDRRNSRKRVTSRRSS